MKKMILALVAFGIVSVSWSSVPITVRYTDDQGEGFFDPELGEARRNAMSFAVQHWSALLDGEVPVEIHASFNPLGGTSTSARLAGAIPFSIVRNFRKRPRKKTWYPIALANQIAGRDLNPDSPDILITFNSDIDSAEVLGDVDWYYGTDANPAGNDIDMVSAALHEICHGLGLGSFVDGFSGAFFFGDPDIYSVFLHQFGEAQLTAMTDSERFNAIRSNNLFLNGTHVTAPRHFPAKAYSPREFDPGSSVSHFDTLFDPNELMEPFYTGPLHDLGLAMNLLADLGWVTNTMVPSNFDNFFFLEGTSGYVDIETIEPIEIEHKIGTARLEPVSLSVDRNGLASGIMRIIAIDEADDVVFSETVPVTGRVKFKSSGVVGERVKFANVLRLVGRGKIDRTSFVFKMVGKEVYQVLGNEEDSPPGFTTRVVIAVSKLARAKSTETIQGFGRAEGEYASTDLQPKNSKGTVWTGSANLFDDFGAAFDGSLKLVVKSSVPERNRVGRAKAVAKNGKMKAVVVGRHGGYFLSSPNLAGIDSTFVPERIVFRGPAGGESLRIR